MLDAHYKSKINIADYWSVGDTRVEQLPAISKSEGAQLQEYDKDSTPVNAVIIGINHDNLNSSINGITKAAITVQLREFLIGAYPRMINGNYVDRDNEAGMWDKCPRRDWCNNTFLNSILDNKMAKLVKPVVKLTNRHAYTYKAGISSNYRTQISTYDSVFILSEYEVANQPIYYSDQCYADNLTADGVQYEYYQTASSLDGNDMLLRSSVNYSSGDTANNVTYEKVHRSTNSNLFVIDTISTSNCTYLGIAFCL